MGVLVMLEKRYLITSHAGVHARPATILVSSMAPFQAEVSLEYKEKKVNLKSIMGVMSLGIPEGATIKIAAHGVDEVHAIEKIDEIIKANELGE
jgi:phosphocarrier protein